MAGNKRRDRAFSNSGKGIPDAKSFSLESLRDGDPAAFKELFEYFYEPLCRFVFGIIKRKDISEELVQDVFVTIWEQKSGMSAENVRAWLYRMARNRALDYLKHEKVIEKYKFEIEALYDDVPGHDTLLEKLSFEEAVNRAIEELPESCRTTFILNRRDGLTYAEIAEAMDISVKTVESRISRALSILRVRLKRFLPALMLLTLQSALLCA